jgi:hypothetical protein
MYHSESNGQSSIACSPPKNQKPYFKQIIVMANVNENQKYMQERNTSYAKSKPRTQIAHCQE